MLRRSAMRCVRFSCSQTLGLLACAHGFPGSFSGNARTHFAFPERFRAMCGRTLLSRRIFGLLAFAHCFPRSFLGFARLRIAFPTRFRALRVRARLPRRVFGLLALAHCFPRSVFGFLACAHDFPGAFSGFSRVRTASLARFWLSRVCALLAWRVFELLALAHGFPGVFSGFSRVRICRKAKPCLRVFVCSHCSHFVARQSRAYRVFLRKTRAFCGKKHKNSRHIFGFLVLAHGFLSQGGAVLCRSAMRCLRFSCSQTLGLCAGAGGEEHFQFGSDKNQHTVRSFLWQKLRN